MDGREELPPVAPRRANGAPLSSSPQKPKASRSRAASTRTPEVQSRRGRKPLGVGEAARAKAREDEALGPGVAGDPARHRRGGVAEGPRPLRAVFWTVCLVDEEVSVSCVLDRVRPGAGVGGVGHRRASLSDAEADALQAVVDPEGGDPRILGGGRLSALRLGPAEALAEPVLDARDSEVEGLGPHRLRR
jgi:hypothetical protein